MNENTKTILVNISVLMVLIGILILDIKVQIYLFKNHSLLTAMSLTLIMHGIIGGVLVDAYDKSINEQDDSSSK